MKVLDLPKVAVVVPTYWCSGPGAQKHGPFDHPTPLGAPSTLGRLLESLALQKEVEFILIVVVAGCPPWVVPRAEAEVRRILAPFRKLWPVLQLGRRETISLREWAQRLGAPASALGLADYGQVRNLQLLASLLLGAEVIVALDDDEVLPPGYLKRAMELVGQRVDGAPVLGIAGVYRHADGSYELPSAAPSGNPFLDKASLINSALAQLLSCSERAVETPFAFGGSMVLHWQLARSVPFDPWIGRGEDIDYVLSARLFGFRFWLDKELWVTHLPPVEYRASPCAILRRDVWRFLYQRAKLAAARTRGLIVDL
ncbi:MAG: hypothetical protein H5U03_04215, partial [Clostridia bacterium]|nr:hypothetical protein [Clostridia bacterium]